MNYYQHDPPADEKLSPDEETQDPDKPNPVASEEKKSWLDKIAQGAWEIFKSITGISNWQEIQKIHNDPSLDLTEKQRRIQYLATKSVFDLVGMMDVPGMSEATKMAANPVRAAIKKAGEKIFEYMQKVVRYAEDLTPL